MNGSEGDGGGREERPPKIRINDRRRVKPEDLESPPSPDSVSAAEPPEPKPAGAQELRGAQEEAAAHLDDLRRLKAEFENYRKRVIKEQTELVERATAGLVSRLLAVLDNFELAVASAEQSRDFDRMLKGVELVYGELKEALASEGLGTIDARGKPFDPHLHEAALEVGGDPEGEPFVAEVLRTGYTLKGRVLRPVMVKVSRRGRDDQ